MVILFFGDHWPNLEEGFLSQLLGQDPDNLSFENVMREYQVPFLIWANYDLDGEEIDGVSLNYLSGLLLRAAGLEGTDYTNFLENLRQTLPVIAAVDFRPERGGHSLRRLAQRVQYFGIQQRLWRRRQKYERLYPGNRLRGAVRLCSVQQCGGPMSGTAHPC